MEPDADDVTLLAQAWPRTEQAMVNRAGGDKVSFQVGEASLLVDAVRRAMRVEVQTADHGPKYVLLFDMYSNDGPHPAKYVIAKLEKVEQLAKPHTPHRIRRVPTEVRIVPRDQAVAGVTCPRLMPAPRGTPWVDPELPPGAVSVRVLLRHEAHHGSARSDWDRLAGAVGAHARAEPRPGPTNGHRPGASARQGGGSLSRPVPEVVLLAPEVSAPTGGDAL